MNEDLCHSLQHIGNLPGSLSTWSPAYNSFDSTWSMILGQDWSGFCWQSNNRVDELNYGKNLNKDEMF